MQKERQELFAQKMAEGARMAAPEPEPQPQPPRPFMGRLPKKSRKFMAAVAEERALARAQKMTDLELATHESLESAKGLSPSPPQLLTFLKLALLAFPEAQLEAEEEVVGMCLFAVDYPVPQFLGRNRLKVVTPASRHQHVQCDQLEFSGAQITRERCNVLGHLSHKQQ